MNPCCFTSCAEVLGANQRPSEGPVETMTFQKCIHPQLTALCSVLMQDAPSLYLPRMHGLNCGTVSNCKFLLFPVSAQAWRPQHMAQANMGECGEFVHSSKACWFKPHGHPPSRSCA